VGDVAGAIEEIGDLTRQDRQMTVCRPELVGDSVNGQGVGVNGPLGIDEQVQRPAGRELVFKLDTANFDNPVDLIVEPCRLGVENDFAHAVLLGFAWFSTKQLMIGNLPARDAQGPFRCRSRNQRERAFGRSGS
jgi:hypothetical protein